ncbi:hypothetical protein MF406_10905 [Georgenia sp. TF02-10]|uniref:hypothetical protein n=1 Tax=Georgenia sp. TF02-10 TaxID=2917725 RepID=UPI001FA741BA|nr:hypothetical protein [Georgenia sp. TF02-10]UNX53505.1 hypothetical protein MF406_10905 [Georgenia sp. TF02-10]
MPRTPDAPREDALRGRLVDDPNDIAAFRALAEVVRRRAAGVGPADPLTGDPEPADRERAENLAVWALAEEIAGNPRAWYALIELARLSLADDHDGAMRRLNGACERDSTGQAVAESIRMLREAGQPGEAIGLGVGHWNPKEHVVEAGRQLVLACVEAGRPLEARRHLEELRQSSDQAGAAAVAVELERVVGEAEAAHPQG